MANLSVKQKRPATLGDVLYAKAKAPVPEQDWATSSRCMRCMTGLIASSSL
jgi:hypothetical protein